MLHEDDHNRSGSHASLRAGTRACQNGTGLGEPRMSFLLILNDLPCGTERTFNGLRFPLNLLGEQVMVWA
jgi:hypothetical protein